MVNLELVDNFHNLKYHSKFNFYDFYEFLPTLLRAGYKPQNIHLIWILTDYRMALVQNRKRARTVPDKILIKTHKGAARTMRDYFIRNYPPDINGEFYVIIGGPQNTVFFSNNKGKALNGSDGLPFAIKDFQYFKLKNAGRSNIDKDSEIARKVYDLVDRYAPDLSEQMIPLSPIAIAPMVGPVLDRSELEGFNIRAKAKDAAVEDRLRNRPIFPPEADTDGDGQLSVYEFVLYVDIIAQELGISDDLKSAVIALLTGRPLGAKGLLALASASNRKKLKKLLKRINKRFNGGRGLGLPFERDQLTTAFSPLNFIFTNTYGIAPYNTTLTFRYLTGGGVNSNVDAGTLTVLDDTNFTFVNPNLSDTALANQIFASVSSNNPLAADGGQDGDTVEELRLNAVGNFQNQLRTVTKEDYLVRALSMPSNLGTIAKAYAVPTKIN